MENSQGLLGNQTNTNYARKLIMEFTIMDELHKHLLEVSRLVMSNLMSKLS